MAVNLNGITYYKLDSSLHGYQGDITKNCGLRGEEIDGNFNFLRGNDVKEISFNELGDIIITKYNGEILIAKQSEKPEYDFIYDSENDILTIKKPNGEEITLNCSNKIEEIHYDSSVINGNGDKNSPITLSNIAKTGRYKPAIKLIDLTENGDKLPSSNISVHDRYVTKEKHNVLGYFYPLHGALKINNRLIEIGSEWHVPSKKEWDDMLNAIDCTIPNHDSIETNVELGEMAASFLKSKHYWDAYNENQIITLDKYGFSIYPVGTMHDTIYSDFGKKARFWTLTNLENEDNTLYAKSFKYSAETVEQIALTIDDYANIRLVKKFNGDNFNYIEVIDGVEYNCVHIPGTDLIWTIENVNFNEPEYDGIIPKELETIISDNNISIKYFINDWNGSYWDKQQILEGESLILHDGINGEYHEWFLLNGELIDNTQLLKEELRKINVDPNCNHIKYNDEAIYFDGNFGQF